MRARSSPPSYSGYRSGSLRVVRAVSSLVLSALMVLTLLWGGCISCPQFFMFPTAATGAKACCRKDGSCKNQKPAPKTTAKECKRISLEPASAPIELAVDLPPSFAPLPTPALPLAVARTQAAPADDSPPDRLVLHSTFLI